MSALMKQIMVLSPTHYWLCNEASGTSADRGSNPLAVTWNSVSLGAAGIYGIPQEQAVALNGSTGWGNTPTDATPTNFTVGFFAFRTNTGQVIPLSYATSGNPLRIGFHTASDKYTAFIGDAVGNPWMAVVSPNTIVNSRWYAVAMTYDGTTLRLYEDGVQTGSTTTTSGSRDTTASTWWIGRYNSSFANLFAGRMAHLFVAAAAATADQVAGIYKAGIRGGVVY